MNLYVLVKNYLATWDNDVCLKLLLTLPSFSGDHIRIKRFLYNHHMIVVEVHDDEWVTVIHYTGGRNRSVPSSFSAKRRASIIEERKKFSGGEISKLEILTYHGDINVFPPTEAICRARSRKGEEQYNLFFSNCENFVNWALTDKKLSAQGDKAFVATSTSTGTAAGATGGAVFGGIVGGVVAGPLGAILGGVVGICIGGASAGTVVGTVSKITTHIRRYFV